MPRSIRIYALHSDEDVGRMRDEIAKHRPQSPIVEVDGKKHRPEIAVGPRRGADRLYGIVRVPTATAADDGPVLGHNTYSFYLAKAPATAAIEGNQKVPYDILRAALGGTAEISPHAYDKRRMVAVSDAIRASGNAIIHDPRFEFGGGGSDGYDGLFRSGFTVTRSRCATTRSNYDKMLERASVFEPVLRVFRADGICDETSEMGKLLKINRRYGFSMYVDLQLDMWIRFIKKYALPALEGDE